MAYIAFIPARSGSKRLPGKNIKLLSGKPLVVYTLEAFIKVDKVDKVIFSTDSIEYWELVTSYISSPKLELNLRTADDAGDKVKIFDYLKQSYEQIFENLDDVFLMGLPTVPLRTSLHVKDAIELFEQKEKAAFSATEYGFPVSFSFYQKDDSSWEASSPNSPMISGNTRSQDQRPAYHPNGAIYIRKVSDFSNNQLKTLYIDAIPYLMERIDSVDIDNEVDFVIAEALLNNR